MVCPWLKVGGSKCLPWAGSWGHASGLRAWLVRGAVSKPAGTGVWWAGPPLNPALPQIVSTCGGPDIARSVSSPLLSREAVGFLRGHLVPKEMTLWESLGETWTRPRCGSGQWAERVWEGALGWVMQGMGCKPGWGSLAGQVGGPRWGWFPWWAWLTSRTSHLQF